MTPFFHHKAQDSVVEETSDSFMLTGVTQGRGPSPAFFYFLLLGAVFPYASK